MKKIIFVILVVTLYSCGSKKSHCDAYGNKASYIDLDKKDSNG